MNLLHIGFLLAAYLIGSIPFSLIVTRLLTGKDLRKVGSKNIGATNVARVNKKVAVVALILDLSKGVAPLLIFEKYNLSEEMLYLIGASSVVGHIFPVWLKFMGGKGVATFLGTLIVLDLRIFSVFLLVWIISFVIFRYSSMSSIIAITSSLVPCLVINDIKVSLIFLASLTLILIKHKENIVRLATGRENKVL